MSTNGTKPKKQKIQKLIIPKGTIDPNDTTVIEIPAEFKNQDIVIAKKSAQTINDPRSRLEETYSSGNYGYNYSGHSNTYASNYSNKSIYPQINPPCGRKTESESQTPYDERDIETLLQDLESYYRAQKNFLIKSSTMIRQKNYREDSHHQSCSCAETNTGTPTVIVLKGGCLQDINSACSIDRQHKNVDLTRSWGATDTRMNASAPRYEPMSTSRNYGTDVNNTYGPLSSTSSSFDPNRSQKVNLNSSDLNYDSFRDEANRTNDMSRRNYSQLLNSKTRFALAAEDLRKELKLLIKRNNDNYYNDLLDCKNLFAEKAEDLRLQLKQLECGSCLCIDCYSQEIISTKI